MTSKILRADGTTELASIQSVTYHESVNADTDLRPGCVASNYIEVTCFGAQSDAPDVGEALTYYQVVGETETLIGIFYAEPSIPTKNSYSFVAYDAVHKLDADFSSWLSAHQDDFPYTVKQLVEQACTISGVTLGTSSWDHSTMSVNAWYADGLTCRNILQYAAEIACKFVRCNTDGEIVFDWYKGAASGETNTASGTIATFDDGADRVPLKSLTAQITPVQDLHGYSNPWPAGGGKNKLPNDATTSTIQGVTFTVNADKTITANGTSTGWKGLTVSTFTLPAGEYKLVSLVRAAYTYNCYLSITANGTAVASTSSNSNGVAFTLTEETTLVCKLFARPNNALSNVVCYPMIILATETDVSYLPYSNECPISGWTGLEGQRTGKNLLNTNGMVAGILNASGVVDSQRVTITSKGNGAVTWESASTWRGVTTGFIDVRGNNVYRLSLAETVSYVLYAWYDRNQTFISRASYSGDNMQSVTAPGNAFYVRFTFQQSAAGTYTYTNIQLEHSSSASAYESFNGETLSVNWQDTAGTVYGGSMTVNKDGSGELVATFADVDLGDLTWTYTTGDSYAGSPYFASGNVANKKAGSNNMICSQYAVGVNRRSIQDCIIAPWNSTNALSLACRDDRFTDAATFKSAMSGVQLIYELATPQTYHFDNLTQLTTLLGTNNIWATTGDVEVEYYPTLGRIYPSSGTDESGDRFAYKQDGLTYDNYDTSAVARVAVHPVGEDEVAYYYPTNVTSGNTLNITNNALLYGASSTDMLSIAQRIYTTMTAFGTYRPMTVDMFPNECPFRCGDIVPVTDAQGVSFTTAIMEKTVTDSAVTLTSTGREVYGDYALDTAKKLVQLASDIVRINKLKVGWAEIDEAVVGVLTSHGMNPDEVVVSANTVTEYYLSTSSSSATGGSWGTSIPTWSSGKYVWTRDKTTNEYADGTSSTSYSPSQNGVYDANLTTALSTAASASSAASTAQSTANGANAREQTIYISKASGTSSVAENTTWVTDATGNQNTWTTKRPVYNGSYPVLFIAQQRQTVTQYNGGSGTGCSCTTPVKDDTTTVIDGGHITTGTIDASVVNVTNINASNITTGALIVRDANNNIIFKADASNKTVQIGGWTADASSLRSSNTTYASDMVIGNGQIIFRASNSLISNQINIHGSVSSDSSNRPVSYLSVSLGGSISLRNITFTLGGADVNYYELTDVDGSIAHKITGNLTIQGSSPNAALKNTIADTTASSISANASSMYSLLDKNGRQMGYYQSFETTAGSVQTWIVTKRVVNGADVSNHLGFFVNADGTKSVSVSDPAAWLSALSNAAPTTTSTVSQIISLGSGWTASVAQFATWGKIGMLRMNVSRSTAQSSAAEVTVGTLVAGKRPVINTGGTRPNDPNKTVYITSAGVVSVYGSFAANGTIAIVATYILA